MDDPSERNPRNFAKVVEQFLGSRRLRAKPFPAANGSASPLRPREAAPCQHCHRLPMRVSRLRQSGELVVDLDDACIPDLPGVRFACCGHGHERAYLVLTDGTKLLGDDALALMRRLGGSPPDPREEESS